MGKLILRVIVWILRKFGLLLLLVGGLLLAPSVWELWRIVGEFDPISVAQEIKKKIEILVPGKDAPREEVERNVKVLQELLAQRTRERTNAQQEKASCLLPTCNVVQGAKLYRLDLEIEFLKQALLYSDALITGKSACDIYRKKQATLNELRVLEAALTTAKSVFPASDAHLALRVQIAELEAALRSFETACQTYRQLAIAFEVNKNSARQKLAITHGKFLADWEQRSKSRSRVLELAMSVLPTALVTLAGIIFLPIGIKLATYYGVATLASRRFGVRLLPESSGELVVVSPPQALQRIDLEKGWELLIAPSLLRSSPDAAVKRTKIVLDWSMPLSSIATGLYLLTCVRTEGTGTMTISAGEEDHNEITVLEVPANSALVLQPRCLAGVIQRIDAPIKITRPWRLGNLGSWLTLQLRYVVFHGPAKLIVKGNRGVEVDAAQAGTSINQAATLGFSANLGYGVTRSGTFYGYLSGKNELFNDCFSSGPGYYVHEVRPRPAATSLLPGRGIEGILSSILKAFGL